MSNFSQRYSIQLRIKTCRKLNDQTLVIVTISVTRTFFLKNTDVGPKKHEKNEPKSPKKRGKNGFLYLNFWYFDPPLFFIAFLCINIFQIIQKIGKIFRKKIRKKDFLFKKDFFWRCFGLTFWVKNLCIFWQKCLFFEQK